MINLVRRSGLWLAATVVPLVAGMAALSASAETSLVDAIKTADVAAVRTVLSRPRGRDEVNVAEADGTTALHLAADIDSLPLVQQLLQAGANPRAANRNGVTPLSLAAGNGNPAMVKVLLKAGARVDASLPEGQTILMSAARTGNAEVVKLLIAAGADVNARERLAGETPLIWAAAEDHADVVHVPARAGADVNARSSPQRFPRERFGDGIVALQTVLPKGNWTPLMYAARQSAIHAVEALADAGANLDAADPEGTTALIVAINNAHFDVAERLLEKGAAPNVADTTGMTALYAAVEMNTGGRSTGRPAPKPSGRLTAVDLIKLLLDRGADANVSFRTGLLPKLHMSSPSFGAGTTPLMRAARSADVVAMRLLLDYGADATERTTSQTTALMAAVGATGVSTEARREAITLCLDYGADIDAVNDTGQSALHLAVPVGDEIVTLLARRGAKLDVKDKQGRTPLDVALGTGSGGRRGRGPATVRESTVALLRDLMRSAGALQ